MTTQKLRLQIEVSFVEEDNDTAAITYWKKNKQKCLILDKKENTHLMQFVDGPISQWDAINIVCAHEQKMIEEGIRQYFDMATVPSNQLDN